MMGGGSDDVGGKNGRSLLFGFGYFIEDVGGLFLGRILVLIVEGTFGAGQILIKCIEQEILRDIIAAALSRVIHPVLLVDVVVTLLDSPVQLFLRLH